MPHVNGQFIELDRDIVSKTATLEELHTLDIYYENLKNKLYIDIEDHMMIKKYIQNYHETHSS